MKGRKRQTIQRQLVARAVRESDHPSAQQVYDFIVKEHTISIAAVYNNLSALVGEGKLAVLRGTADRYDWRLEQHVHARCTVCGRIDDVFVGLEALADDVRKASGYELTGHDIQFSGICPKCKKR